MRHLLVGLDFSEPSRRALALARELRARLHAAVTVVHVHEVPSDVSKGWIGRVVGGVAPYEAQTRAPDLERLHREVVAVAREVFGPDAQAIETKVVIGRPVDQILEMARAEKADCICVGTTGRTGIERMLLGSVAERLVRASPVPVLTVH